MGRFLIPTLLLLTVGLGTASAAPPAPGKTAPLVAYDAARTCVLVDGQPFFAIGCYDTVPEYMAECAAAGFNLAAHFQLGSNCGQALKQAVATSPEAARTFLTAYADAAQRAGLWTLESPLLYQDYGPAPNWGAPPGDSATARFLDEPLTLTLQTLRQHPAVLGLMGVDEPAEGWQAGVETFYRAARRLDPSRPVVVNFSRRVQEWPGAYDVVSADFYPVVGQTPLVRICEETRANVALARRMGKPYWFIPLLESFEKSAPLGPREQIAQTYLAVVGGATGIVWWTWPPRHAQNWTALKGLAGELRRLTPVLTETADQPPVIPEPASLRRTVQVRVIRHGPVTFVLAVNAVPTPVEAEFELPTAVAGQANVWFENRTVALRQGRWTDHFAGLERHVYALQTTWPGQAPLRVRLTLGEPPAPRAEDWGREGNLIPDPGVESDDGWQARVFPTDQPGHEGRTCALDTVVVHGGRRAAGIVFSGAGKNVGWDTPTVRLAPNTLYRYGAWARMEAAGEHHAAAVIPLSPSGIALYAPDVLNYAGWQEYSALLWSGKEGGDLWLRGGYGGFSIFAQDGDRGDGRAWFDDAFVIPAPAGVRNMVINGGFEREEALPQWPADWVPLWSLLGRPGCVGGPDSPWGVDRTVAWEGGASLKLVNAGSTAPSVPGWTGHTVDAAQFLRGIRLEAGQTYVCSAYLKADRPGRSVVFVPGGWAGADFVKVTGDWQRVSLRYTPTEPVNGLGFVAFQLKEQGTVWVDGVQFEAGSEPTDYRCWQ